MKRLAKLLLVFVAVFCLTACGSKKYDFTCKGDIDGQKGTISGKVKDGKVVELIAETTSEAKSKDEAKQQVALLNSFGAMMKEQGIVMEAKASGKDVVTTMTIDVAKAAKNSTDSSLGVDLENATKDAMVKAFEKQGLSCK